MQIIRDVRSSVSVGLGGRWSLRVQTHRPSASETLQVSWDRRTGRGTHAVGSVAALKPWLVNSGSASAFLPHLVNYAAVLARGPE